MGQPTAIGDPLTDRQQEILDFIRRHLEEHQKLPSVRELAIEFGIRSPNGVSCHLHALAAKGRIRWARPFMTPAYRLAGVRLRIEDTGEGEP